MRTLVALAVSLVTYFYTLCKQGPWLYKWGLTSRVNSVVVLARSYVVLSGAIKVPDKHYFPFFFNVCAHLTNLNLWLLGLSLVDTVGSSFNVYESLSVFV